MNIHDGVKMGGSVSSVEGTVKVEYRDGTTGKLKNRSEKKNHIFVDAFRCSEWSNVLDGTQPVMFVTNDGTSPDDQFPYLRGQILGWVSRGTPDRSGISQGQYVSADSWRLRDISLSDPSKQQGTGVSIQYTGNWNPDQIVGDLKCVGITNQYRPFLLNTTRAAVAPNIFSLRSTRERIIPTGPTTPVSSLGLAGVIRNGIKYSLHQSAATAVGIVSVIKHNLFTGERDVIDVSRYFNGTIGGNIGAGQQRSVGVAFDTNRAYLAVQPTTVANRRVYEFADDTFDDLLNTYPATNSTVTPTPNIFAILGNRMYDVNNNGLSSRVFNADVAWEILAPILTCPYNTNLWTGNERSLTIKDGILYTFGGTSFALNSRMTIYNLVTNQPIATVAPFGGGDPGFIGIVPDPSLNNRQFLHLMRGSQGNAHCDYVVAQALAAYVDIEPRPDNSIVTISYRIDVMF